MYFAERDCRKTLGKIIFRSTRVNTESLLKTCASPYKYGKAILAGSGVAGTFDSLAVAVYSWRTARIGKKESRA
jgi:hypothetical protein